MTIPAQITSPVRIKIDPRDLRRTNSVGGMALAAEFFVLRFFDFVITRAG